MSRRPGHASAQALAHTDGAHRRITVRLVLAVFGILVTLTTAWALATPLTAVPDEPAHFVRAGAVAHGELIGRPTTAADFPVVRVPAFIAQTKELTCFAGDPTRTADCQDPVTTSSRLVDSGTSAAFNSPLYYAAVGWPSLILSGAPALYSMRIVSAMLTSLLLTAMMLALVAQSRSWWPVAAATVGLTPMVLYLGGALNPNAIEMAAAGAVLAVIALLLRVPVTDAQRWRWGAVAVAASFALMSGRGIGVLWLALIAAALAVMVPWNVLIHALTRPATWFTLIGMAVATGLLGGWTLYLGSVTGGAPEEPIAPRAPGILTVTGQMFENTFDYWMGWIGQFGWLDYLAPAGIQVVWHAALVAVLFSGLVLAVGRTRMALVFLVASTLIIPPLIQAGYYNEIGLMWQGRYSLALYLGCLILAGLALDDTFPASRGLLARKTVLAGAVVLAVASIAAFVFVLRRYMIGSQLWIDMFREPSWQPPGGWIVLLLATTAAWASAVWLLVRWTGGPGIPAAPAASVVTR